MAISNIASNLRPGVVTSTTRPTSPYTGQMIYETDTKLLRIWDGSAWDYVGQSDAQAQSDLNAVGLWLVKTQTIGTAVSSVTVNNAFSADFDCYRVIVKGGSASAENSLRMTLGATTSGYYQGGYGSTYAGATNVANINNGAFFAVGNGSTSTLFASIDVFDPFSTNETTVSGFAMSASTTGWFSGFLDELA